jgi:uncharacterized tellurite resistance protein B-like protein
MRKNMVAVSDFPITLHEDNTWRLAYLFVCVAKSDYQLVEVELETIFHKLNEMRCPKGNTQDFLQDVLTFHEKQTEEEIQQHILLYCKALRNIPNVKEVLQTLEAIIEADGIIKDLEINMFFHIKELINSEKVLE